MKAFFFEDFTHAYIPHILKEIYLDAAYGPLVSGRSDMVIVDAGANIGLTAHYFSNFAKRVIAVEPCVGHRRCLEEMVRFNGIANVDVAPYALSTQPGTAKLFHNGNTTMHSLNPRVDDHNSSEDVQTIGLDGLMRAFAINTIDLLKLDVEGHEGEIIESAAFRSVADRVKVIAGEWHSWGETSQDRLRTDFEELGFTFRWAADSQASLFTAMRR